MIRSEIHNYTIYSHYIVIIQSLYKICTRRKSGILQRIQQYTNIENKINNEIRKILPLLNSQCLIWFQTKNEPQMFIEGQLFIVDQSTIYYIICNKLVTITINLCYTMIVFRTQVDCVNVQLQDIFFCLLAYYFCYVEEKSLHKKVKM